MDELHDDCAGPLVCELVEMEAHVERTCARLAGLAGEKEDFRRRAIAESRGLQTRDIAVAGAEHVAYLRSFGLLINKSWSGA